MIQVMKEGMRLEDVPELMQNIQLRLPVNAAAQSSVLSKSWLHAWSTIPNLIFHVPKEEERKQLMLVYIDNTLRKYLRDNIPIESFELNIRLGRNEHASLAEQWIRSVATKTCLKELSFTIKFDQVYMNLPDEILSCVNITKIRVWATYVMDHAVRMTSSHQSPIIKCVSLRELHLFRVRISQQLLDHILSSCRLLENIKLKSCSQDLKTIKIKSLPCLDKLEIYTNDIRHCPSVEINNVPNLRMFKCDLQPMGIKGMHILPFSSVHSISLGSSVTELWIGGPGLVTDDASVDMIKTGVPFLESLTLNMGFWKLENCRFTFASIKRLSLIWLPDNHIGINLNTPKLLFLHLDGSTMPSLSFPTSTTLEEITFRMKPRKSFDASFLLKMREALELSRKCYLHIAPVWYYRQPPLNMDILDDLKTRLQFPPATNVETLTFEVCKDECQWESSPFFHAFFEICHPKQVIVKSDVCKMMLGEVLEKKTKIAAHWPNYLKHVQMRRPHERWDTLTDSHPRFKNGSRPYYADFKLEWC
ncbi:FBD-associated F-box protein At5g56370 [Lactuca sativa]|uniref:FBD-associated F-box protein At5g56370 n=1 Tax=Lactuca sativa TaxID=4236 RepID=UPI000CD7FCD0|nr:FBD-associated F-box protein At5g56370 [Lactuca sativa]